MAAKPMNKFTKSVLEREQKEQPKTISFNPEEKKVAAPPQKNISEKKKTSVLPKETKTIQPEDQEKKENQSIPETPFLLENFLIPGQGRHAKNKTFYLDAAVIEAIKKAANANRIAESKLVNDILKKVLRV